MSAAVYASLSRFHNASSSTRAQETTRRLPGASRSAYPATTSRACRAGIRPSTPKMTHTGSAGSTTSRNAGSAKTAAGSATGPAAGAQPPGRPSALSPECSAADAGPADDRGHGGLHDRERPLAVVGERLAAADHQSAARPHHLAGDR